MALRVLLADESSTIKKVFQLSLQDFAVDVKSVNLGVDVKAVAEQFQPDIIFADVLLQKKNGYDVSSEIKSDPGMGNTPIVLMWSGFMEIDQDKFDASKADDQLEKPFDVDKLRSIIKKYVPRTASSKVSELLNFPNLPEFEDKAPPAAEAAPPTPEAAAPEVPQPPAQDPPVEEFAEQLGAAEGEEKSTWNMEEFEPINITEMTEERAAAEAPNDENILEDAPEDGNWEQKPMGDFKLDVEVNDEALSADSEFSLDDVVSSPNEPPAQESSMEIPADGLEVDDGEGIEFESSALNIAEGESQEPAMEEIEGIERPDLPPAATPEIAAAAPPVTGALTEQQLEEIIRSQSKELIEKVVWRVVPELAGQIIEREINRLLEEKTNQQF